MRQSIYEMSWLENIMQNYWVDEQESQIGYTCSLIKHIEYLKFGVNCTKKP